MNHILSALLSIAGLEDKPYFDSSKPICLDCCQNVEDSDETCPHCGAVFIADGGENSGR